MTTEKIVSTAEFVRAAIRAELEKSKPAPTKSPVVEAAPVETAPPVSKEPIVIPEGHKHVSDVLTGIAAEFPVRIYADSDFPPELRVLIPDVDPDYRPDIEAAAAILYAWYAGDKVYLHGPAGVGKSSLVAYLCALTRRPLVRFNMSEDVEASSYLGALTIRPGEGTVWVDGAVAEAAKSPGAVLLIDEMDRGTAANLMPLQWLFEDGGKLFLRDKPGTAEDKTIVPHPDFRIVATGNTAGGGDVTGMYASANVLDSATLDRFKMTMKIGYMSAGMEVAMLQGKCKTLDKSLAGNMVKLANLIRSAYASNGLTATCSPRVLISWAQKEAVFGQGVAFQMALLNKLNDTDRKIVIELYRKVFGAEPK